MQQRCWNWLIWFLPKYCVFKIVIHQKIPVILCMFHYIIVPTTSNFVPQASYLSLPKPLEVCQSIQQGLFSHVDDEVLWFETTLDCGGVLFFSFACAFSLPCKVSFAKWIQFLGDLWSPDKGRKRRVLVLN